MSPSLWTIGYEKASWAGVRDALLEAGIRRVIDVRDLPLSRRPGFSKRQLAAGLAEAGIAYTHLRALGTPAEGRAAHRRRDWPVFWASVEQRLATGEAALALVQASQLAAEAPSCLLCYEADPAICHRCRVAERMGGRVCNLVAHAPAFQEPSRSGRGSG